MAEYEEAMLAYELDAGVLSHFQNGWIRTWTLQCQQLGIRYIRAERRCRELGAEEEEVERLCG